ncbi:HemK2/MTQ2 family protein methyltransferase [Mycobacterium sp. HUMS_1102779]|uniref:HemK2/MTQ2 family protein methyltransferase n=1 Tax=Mycobacterium sp. HUMS_1102779 TaxID=3383487 RepID=UPI00389A410B
MTITFPAPPGALNPTVPETGPENGNVYRPQEDSRLLVAAMQRTALIPGRRVLDLCTGSGFVAIAAAELGCAGVTAFDICPHAVRCSRGNAAGAGVVVDVREGSWTRALDLAPFEVVVSNPPYVPTPPGAGPEAIPAVAGPARAWNGGGDGRSILDPLCRSAPKLLCDGGTMLMVQSAFADAGRSLDILRSAGMQADIVASEPIPFGPVLMARAAWLERTGRIPRGCREEELVVIRADKR